MRLILYFLFPGLFIYTDCYPKNKRMASLYYLVRKPNIQSIKPPLLLLLHGVGSNEQDLFSFADRLPAQYLIVSVRAPYILGTNRYAWYEVDLSKGAPIVNAEQAEQSRYRIIQFLEELKSMHAYDESRIYLCGFSQGAIMSYSVGLTRPDLIRGIAILSGRILSEVKPLIINQDKLKHLMVFISHGTKDLVLNSQYAQDAKQYLISLGISPNYNEYDAGHTITDLMLRDLNYWLNE
jgi:phospholipase/carboxylesterase